MANPRRGFFMPFRLAGLCFALCAGSAVGIGESHPANHLRRSILFKKLTSATSGPSFGDVYKKHLASELTEDINSDFPALPSSLDLRVDLAGRPPRNSRVTAKENAIILSILTDYVKKLTDSIFEQASEFMSLNYSTQIYMPSDFDRDLAEL
jgi:hypothetical protein